MEREAISPKVTLGLIMVLNFTFEAATIVVDYSKTFNRTSFQHCWSVLAKGGASTYVHRIVAYFLTGRTMSV